LARARSVGEKPAQPAANVFQVGLVYETAKHRVEIIWHLKYPTRGINDTQRIGAAQIEGVSPIFSILKILGLGAALAALSGATGLTPTAATANVLPADHADRAQKGEAIKGEPNVFFPAGQDLLG
jgi:hypothetical protein